MHSGFNDGDAATDLDAAADGVIEVPLATGSVTTTGGNAGGGSGGGVPGLLLLFVIPLVRISYRYLVEKMSLCRSGKNCFRQFFPLLRGHGIRGQPISTLKEPVTSYMVHLGHEKLVLSDNNTIKLE